MSGKTHILVGVTLGGSISAFIANDISGFGLIMLASYFGSLLPDIDNRNSTISYKMPVTSCILFIVQKIVRLLSGLFPMKIKKKIRILIGHRGIMHSLLGIVFVSFGMFKLMEVFSFEEYATPIIVGVTLGMLSHVVLDMFSNGVPLLLPFTTKRVVLGHIKTCGLGEKIFCILYGICFALIVLYFIST